MGRMIADPWCGLPPIATHPFPSLILIVWPAISVL